MIPLLYFVLSVHSRHFPSVTCNFWTALLAVVKDHTSIAFSPMKASSKHMSFSHFSINLLVYQISWLHSSHHTGHWSITKVQTVTTVSIEPK